MARRAGLATCTVAAILLGMGAVSPCGATVYNPIGKAMWLAYDGTDVTLDPPASQKVRYWNNQAQAQYSAFHNIESRRPDLVTVDTGNGPHPVLEFDGVEDFLRVTMPDQAQPNTVFIVAARQTVGTSYLVDGQYKGKRHGVFAADTGSTQRMYAGGGGAYSTVPATAGRWDLYTAQFHTTASSLRLNGAQIASGNAGSHVAGNLNIGSRYTIGNANFDGYMAEFLFYNQALTPAEVLRVETYLKDKYFSITPHPTANFDAAAPGADPANAWQSTTAISDLDFDLTSTPGPTHVIPVANGLRGLQGAYVFDGDDVAKAASYRYRSTGDWSSPVTFELWVSPSDLTGQEVLFEVGGDVGSAIVLDGDDLVFLSNDDQLITLRAQDVLDSASIAEFSQIVGVIDTVGGEMALYLNGRRVAEYMDTVNRWTGADATGLGGVNGKYGGAGRFDFTGYSGFDGEIGIYRFYEMALTHDDVLRNYSAVVPEPATVALLAGGLLSLGASRRRRRGAA